MSNSTVGMTGPPPHAGTQLRLFQTVPLFIDNLYPYSCTHRFHTVPSPHGASSARMRPRHEQLAAHLEGGAVCSIYMLRSQPDASVQWRLLADRRTLELRPLRWISSQGSAAAASTEITQSAASSWRFASQLLPTVVISDETTANGVARVTVSVCTVDGTVYQLRFGNVHEIADPELDAAACTTWYRASHCKDAKSLPGRQPVALEGVGASMLVVGCGDGGLVWLALQRIPEGLQGDMGRFVSESVSGAQGILTSVKGIFPRMLSGESGHDSESNELVSLATTRAPGSTVRFAVTLSRDRKLRFWTSAWATTLQHEEQLPLLDLSGNTVSIEPWDSPQQLLDPRAGNYIRIVSDSRSESAVKGCCSPSFCVLVFVCDEAAPYFIMLHVLGDAQGRITDVQPVMRKVCQGMDDASQIMADDELIDFQVSQHDGVVRDGHAEDSQAYWTLWALWKRSQESVIAYSHFILHHSGAGGLRCEDHPIFGKRWYTAISPAKSVRPDSGGARVKDIEARLAQTVDTGGQSGESDSSVQPLDIEKAFLDHLFNPSRFDRGVLEHALDQYMAWATGHGFDLPAETHEITASNLRLRQRVASAVGSFLQVQTSPKDGSMLVGEYHRSLFTEWMRYSTLCARVQRTCNTPKSLAVCGSTNMVCAVGGNTLHVVQAAGEVECMRAIMESDPAASVLLSVPEYMVALSYPLLAKGNVRAEIARFLAASSYLAGVMPKDKMLALVDEVAREPSISTLVSYEVRAVELFEKHVAGSVSAKHAQYVGRMLGLCRAPGDTACHILSTLNQSTEFGGPIGDAESALKSSCTMDGLLLSGFAKANRARLELSRDLMLLLVCAVYYCDRWWSVKLHNMPELLAICTKALNQFALIQWVADQSLNSPSGAVDDSTGDGFLGKFSVLNIDLCNDTALSRSAETGRETSSSEFVYSLLHDIVSRNFSLHIVGSSRAFADMMADGVLQVYAHLGVTGPQGPGLQARGTLVEFAAKLERSATAEVTEGFLQFLPKSTALSFLSGVVSMRLREFAMAAELFANAGVAFAQTSDCIIQGVDLPHVLPAKVLQSGGASSYYRYIADMFESAHQFEHVGRFCHLALEALQEESRMDGFELDEATVFDLHRDLWFKIFHAELECAHYEDAYMAMMAIPDKTLQLDCLRHMLGVLCEREGGVAVLCRLGFSGMQEEVERNLLFKARHFGLTGEVNYYKILYAFHVYRGNYRNAASAMYQYACRLGQLMVREGDFASMLVDQGQALLACINGLQLVDKQYAWVVIGHDGGSGAASGNSRKRRCIAVGRYDAGTKGDGIDIVEIDDIRREYALCMARITLGAHFGDLFSRDVAMEPEDAVALFVKAGMYDSAVTFVNTVGLRLDFVLTSLTMKCLELSSIGSAAGQREATQEAFWENERIAETSGTPAERAWHLLQHYLDKHDSQPDRLLVAETILKAEDDAELPPWLASPLLLSSPQDLVRLCLRNGCVSEGAGFLFQHINNLRARILSDSSDSKGTREFWLPYQLVDQTLNVLGSSIEAFEDAVEKIRNARRQCSQRTEGARLKKLLKSYQGRLDSLGALQVDLHKALDRYVAIATSESQRISECLAHSTTRAC